MIDFPKKDDILNLSTSGTDFLCQQDPLVCAVEPKPFLWSTQKTGFLLEKSMPKGVYKRTIKHLEKMKKSGFKKGHIPWSKSQKGVCLNTGRTHFKKGQKKTDNWKKVMLKFKGKGNPAWNGGERNIKNYIYVYMPTHPNAIKSGCVKRSRLVMEKKIGRYLKPKEVVHHINGIKMDDRYKNLILFSNNSEHLKFERSQNGSNKCETN